MTSFFKKIIKILLLSSLVTVFDVHAATMYIDAPKTASSNRGEFTVSIMLNTEGSSVSALSGNFSFPSELFDIGTITSYNSIVPLWVTGPKLSPEKNFDRRTHIVFEGIIPGGFSGVHHPYYQDVFPGIIFTVTLIPKGEGKDLLKLDDIELHAYDALGTILETKNSSNEVTVPHLSSVSLATKQPLRNSESTTVSVSIMKSDLVNNNTPYLYVYEADPSHTIDHIEIVESSEYDPKYIDEHDWHTVTNPYILKYTSRTKYIHTKIIYTNNTYTLKTIPPVENSQAFLNLSRILISIVIVVALLLHFYGKNFLYIFSQHHTKH